MSMGLLILGALMVTIHGFQTSSFSPRRFTSVVSRIETKTDLTLKRSMGATAYDLKPLKMTSTTDLDDLSIPNYIQDFNKATVSLIKDFIIFFYGDRYFARFYALETIARVPYFSYVSVLHLFETLGWFRRQEYIKVHFAESWNELHHLLIMEELGGDKIFLDRFLAQHVAFFYYWIVIVTYMLSPAIAYDLNKNVEEHAYATYDEYIKTHENELKALPAPQIAIDYYEKGDLSLFDAFQNFNGIKSYTDKNSNILNNDLPKIVRRPIIKTLYDVFDNIREDEAEHARSMKKLQEDAVYRARENLINWASASNSEMKNYPKNKFILVVSTARDFTVTHVAPHALTDWFFCSHTFFVIRRMTLKARNVIRLLHGYFGDLRPLLGDLVVLRCCTRSRGLTWQGKLRCSGQGSGVRVKPHFSSSASFRF
eukprot:gene1338-2587_t